MGKIALTSHKPTLSSLRKQRSDIEAVKLIFNGLTLFDNHEERLAIIQERLLAAPQEEAPVVHTFGPGVYMRELFLKAGTYALGHKQRYEHMNVILKGHVKMLQEDGSMKDVKGPTIFTGLPGRKAGYVVEDCVWINIYATNETDVSKLEEIYLDKEDNWLKRENERCLLEKAGHSGDRKDYFKVLEEFGIEASKAIEETARTDDLVQLPYGSYKILCAASPIDGIGLFASADFSEAELIAPGRLKGKRTIAGRFTNHSETPNARFEMKSNGDIDLIALRHISGAHGGMHGEEITIDYREALSLRGRKVIKCLP